MIGTHPNLTFVLAGSFQEYARYMKAKRLHALIHTYLNAATDLLNVHKPKVIRIGTWYTRPDLSQIQQQMKNKSATIIDDEFEGLA